MAEERPSSGQYDSNTSSHSSSSLAANITVATGDFNMEREEGYCFDFVDKVGEKYDCPICLLVLREPLQTECGHRFCRACILRWLRQDESRCPVDNTPLEEGQLFPDNFAKREILALQVKCPNCKQGCDMIIILKQLQDHLDRCIFAFVPCPNQCSSILMRHEVPGHVGETCPKRKVQCQFCQLEVVNEFLKLHNGSCPALTLNCPFCAVGLRRDQMQNHIDDECPKAKVKCSFYRLGCIAEMERITLPQHMQESLQVHLQLLCNSIVTIFNTLGISHVPAPTGEQLAQILAPPSELTGSGIPTEGQEALRSLFATLSLGTAGPLAAAASAAFPPTSLPSYAALSGVQRTASWTGERGEVTEEDQKEEVSKVSYSSNVNPSKELQGAPQLSVISTEIIQSIKSQNLCQDESLARHEQQMMDLIAKCDHTDKLNRELKSKIRSVENMINDFEGRACNGVYIWKIQTYTKLKREAELGETPAFHSPAFYSGCYGYKLCVRVNLNGVDSAKGTHLSIFIHFMQGEYDDILEWPFSGRIILSVLDQNPQCEVRRHFEETLLAKPSLAAFQRATTPRNHKGFGYMEFLPLNVLDSPTSTYIRNDTLIIRAQVIPSG